MSHIGSLGQDRVVVTGQDGRVVGVDYATFVGPDVGHETFKGPAPADGTSILAPVTLPLGASQSVPATPGGDVDFPRTARVTLSTISVTFVSGFLSVNGLDAAGAPASVTINFKASDIGMGETSVSYDTGPAFSHVSSVTISSVADAQGDETVSVGLGQSVGLAAARAGTFSVFRVTKDGVAFGAYTVDTGNRTFKNFGDSVLLDGTATVDVWWRVVPPASPV